MSETLTGSEREQAIERFVFRDALADLLIDLGQPAGGEGYLFDDDEDVSRSIRFSETLDGPEDLESIAHDLSGDLFYRLWPEDEDTETTEYNLTHARSCLLTAAILTRLGRRPEWCLARAEFHLKLARRDLAPPSPVAA